ncbi:hypothetical protein [Kingella sp. (in: b-proteobacteria)]|nr:hypothetical protein [Kingella sp. (in: b-proteobacteria)]MDO4657260.1 hypothetical protein [Kingella sp. (in: b-proteobacteria)]
MVFAKVSGCLKYFTQPATPVECTIWRRAVAAPSSAQHAARA